MLDLITVGEGGITSVVGYFDQKTFVEQLGLQVILVPANEPPMLFGMSARTDLDDLRQHESRLTRPVLPDGGSALYSDC